MIDFVKLTKFFLRKIQNILTSIDASKYGSIVRVFALYFTISPTELFLNMNESSTNKTKTIKWNFRCYSLNNKPDIQVPLHPFCRKAPVKNSSKVYGSKISAL